VPADELVLATEAFRVAHGRFQEAHASPVGDLQGWYSALGESLFWLCALDEGYSQRYGLKYRSFRNDGRYAREIFALRWARNRAAHGLAILLFDPRTGTPPSVGGPGLNLEQLKWRPTSKIPKPPKRFADKESYKQGERDYDECLAGKEVRYNLRRMNEFFIRPNGGFEANLR
jgi:hypothetical protein